MAISLGEEAEWVVGDRGLPGTGLSARVLAASVERMERTWLEEDQRLDFTAEAIALRFPEGGDAGVRPAQLLQPRRPGDIGNDLLHTFNVVQSNVWAAGWCGARNQVA